MSDTCPGCDGTALSDALQRNSPFGTREGTTVWRQPGNQSEVVYPRPEEAS